MNLIIKNLIVKLFFTIFLFFVISYLPSYSKEIKNIIIKGNERISDDTIILFSEINTDASITNNQLNKILKNLYDSNFFEDVSVKMIDDRLIITVVEAPIIDKIEFIGIKAGLRPAVSDGYPIIGNLNSISSNIICAFGHFRHGVLLAPITAKLVCEMALDKPIQSKFDFFSPSRFNL